jgi:HlyD family secretion protein
MKISLKTFGFSFLGLAVVAGIGYYFYQRNRDKDKVDYLFSEVTRGTISKEITATGTLNASLTVDVGTQVSGIISRLLVDFNDVVKKGQVIAQIDTISLAASVINAEANLFKAQSDLAQQKKELDRYTQLLATKSVAQSDFDQVNSTYLSSLNIVKSAQAQLNIAKVNLKYATIVAPISGIIISRNVNRGQTVAASFSTPTLFTIANDLKKMQLQANIDEADIGQIKFGQPVTFSVDAYPDEKFHGTVQQIRLQPLVTQNVVTYTVIIDTPNPNLKLLPGMNATLSVLVTQHKDVWTVPMSAIFFDPKTKSFTGNQSRKTRIWTTCANVEQGNESSDTSRKCHDWHGSLLTPLRVKRGLDDGSMVEISSDSLREGLKVVVGIKEKEEKKTTGLFTPSPSKGGGRKRGF